MPCNLSALYKALSLLVDERSGRARLMLYPYTTIKKQNNSIFFSANLVDFENGYVNIEILKSVMGDGRVKSDFDSIIEESNAMQKLLAYVKRARPELVNKFLLLASGAYE